MPKIERQAQILTIAQGLFAAHGFHHISMDDIADQANVSKPIPDGLNLGGRSRVGLGLR